MCLSKISTRLRGNAFIYDVCLPVFLCFLLMPQTLGENAVVKYYWCAGNAVTRNAIFLFMRKTEQQNQWHLSSSEGLVTRFTVFLYIEWLGLPANKSQIPAIWLLLWESEIYLIDRVCCTIINNRNFNKCYICGQRNYLQTDPHVPPIMQVYYCLFVQGLTAPQWG